MWVDAIIAVILVFTIVQGFRSGFVFTFIHTVGWVLAVILGFVWYPYVINFLKEKTDFYDSIQKKIAEKIGENADAATSSATSGIPDVLNDLLTKAIDGATEAVANSLSVTFSNLIFNIIGFLIVAIAIKMILLFLTTLFSKKSNDGFIGGIDGFFGLFAGAFKGGIIIFIIMALLVPITSLSSNTFIIDQIDASVAGSYLYDNNFVFKAIKGFL